MICYRDMAFCSFYKDCYVTDCPRAMTEEIVKKAEDFRLPICRFVDKPNCFVEKGEIND